MVGRESKKLRLSKAEKKKLIEVNGRDHLQKEVVEDQRFEGSL
jgi:hypothetical protein